MKRKPPKSSKNASTRSLRATLYLTLPKPLIYVEGRLSTLVITADAKLMHRWDDDVVFKNQARGTEDKRKKEFVNVSLTCQPNYLFKSVNRVHPQDLLRSDFHKRFMVRYY